MPPASPNVNFAERAGVDFSYVSKLENDRHARTGRGYDGRRKFCEIKRAFRLSSSWRLAAGSRGDVQENISLSLRAPRSSSERRASLSFRDDEWRGTSEPLCADSETRRNRADGAENRHEFLAPVRP